MSGATRTLEDDAAEGFLSGYSGRMAVLLAVGWLTILLGRQALPPLLPRIIEDLVISPARAGIALTLMMGLYSLLQYPAGRLSDALSRTTLLVAGIGGLVAGFLLLATVRTYPQLLVGAALIGLSSALYFTPSRAMLSDLFVERRGQAFGLQTTAGMGGGALAAGVAVGALSVATWQAAFLPSVVVLLGVALGLHRWSHEPYVLSAEAGFSLDLRGTIGRLLGTPRLRRLLLMRGLVGFTFQAVVGFLPALLQAEKGFSTPLASATFALVFVVGSVAGPLAGRLSDSVARLRVVLGGLGLGLAGLVGLVVFQATAAVIAGVVTLATGISALFPVMGAYFMDLFPEGSVGGDFGAAKTVYTGLGSVGPTYAGVVAAHASYTAAFAGLTALLVLAVGLVWTIRKGRPEAGR